MKKLLSLALATAVAVTMAFGVNAVSYTPGNSESLNITEDQVISYDTNNDEKADAQAGIQVNQSTNAQKDIAIKATIKEGAKQNVLAASVDKTALEFTYSADGMIWDPVQLKYVHQGTQTAWASKDPIITVTNYSDVDVEVTAGVSNPVSNNVTIAVSGVSSDGTPVDNAINSPVKINSAYNGETAQGSAKTGTFTINLSGGPLSSTSVGPIEVATLTLTLKPVLLAAH